jgi:hypothetical protein
MVALACSIGVLLAAAGCSDDDSQQNNNDNLNNATDASVPDAEAPDAETPDAETPDAGEATGCTGDAPDAPQPMGACCTTDEDCIDRFCLAGYCTTTQCEDDNDCDPTVPGPFPGGVSMLCNSTPIPDYIATCQPGSLQPCGAAGDAACPAGEACVLMWNESATTPQGEAFRGHCMTQMAGNNNLATGEQCDEHADPFHYQCETPGWIFSSCSGRRCTEACDPDNATNTCPANMECVGPLAVRGLGTTVLSGGGLCGGALCGYIEATGDPEVDVQIPGIDAECPSGEVCVPSFVTGVDGDTLEFRCEPEVTGYGNPGDACEQSAKFAEFCNHDMLCLQAQADWSASGTLCTVDEDCPANEVCVDREHFPSRCSPKPDPGFCSQGCRTDADCQTDAYCMELDQELPNGESAFLTACYPESELFETVPTPCTTEADCDAGVGEGCLMLSFHSDTLICGTAVAQDATGVDCSTGGVAACQAGEACVEDEDAGTFLCTAIKEKGEACDPEAQENRCRNGWCIDIEFGTDEGGSPTNTYCSGFCLTSADCGPQQVCANVLFAENDPAVETDDVKVGMCRTQHVRTGTGCQSAADCTGAGTGDSCNTTTGRCYTAGASWGDTCADASDCPLGGFCDTDVPNGLCYLPGCDPATGNADCGGGNTACSAESLVGICLADCATSADCRQADGFTCVSGACVAP